MSDPLHDLRARLNTLDDDLLRLLADRRSLSLQVAQAKEAVTQPVRDQEREQEMLVRLVRTGREHGLDAHLITRVFHEVIEDSLRLQHAHLQRLHNPQAEAALLRVAIQGGEGSYGHLAAQGFCQHHSEGLAVLGFPTHEEAIKAVEQGRADVVVLPVENTISGGINEVYDLLLHTRLHIVGEEKVPTQHCLAGLAGSAQAGLQRIYADAQAVAQCARFLAQADCRIEVVPHPGRAVALLEEHGAPSEAVIVSQDLAQRHDLTILRRQVGDQPKSETRFLVAARNPRQVDLRIPSKTSLVMATGQKAGSLAEALLVFREQGINLTKLESRPVPGNPWEQLFYVDLEGTIGEERVAGALEALTRVTRFIKVLGSYPSNDLPQTQLPRAAMAAVEGSPAEAPAPAEPVKAARPKGHRLVAREHKPEGTVISVKGVDIGGPELVTIAGPCSVESREQILGCAREAREAGAQILRGGCFKPRTSPYSFQGLGFEGLDYLVEAGRTYGLPVITEVLSPEDVAAVAEHADILQIGARNMQNFTLLKEVGRSHRPAMLKRGLMASIDELLHAAEYILAHGNQQVFLCERGIRTFETATRNTLDLSAIPILKERTHLPVIADPSHAAGIRHLVPPLAIAAKAVGAHGIMVEFHPEPEKALSDGPQALRIPQFKELMVRLNGSG